MSGHGSSLAEESIFCIDFSLILQLLLWPLLFISLLYHKSVSSSVQICIHMYTVHVYQTPCLVSS